MGDNRIDDEELMNVTGGAKHMQPKKIKVACWKCQTILEVDMSCSSFICTNPKCRGVNHFAG